MDVDETRILEGLPYVVIGGIATRAYMPERFTKDLDVLVPADAYDDVTRRFVEAGWRGPSPLLFPSSSLGLFGNSWQNGTYDIDVRSSRQTWVDDAFLSETHDTTGLRVISLPYLVLMKLDSSRTQDTADISRMLALANDEVMRETRAVIARYLRDTEALDDLESLREIGRWEMESS
jgi:hypothetical protein